MNDDIIKVSRFDNAPIVINSCMQGKHFESQLIELPLSVYPDYYIDGLDQVNLELSRFDDSYPKNYFYLKGTPEAAGTFILKLNFKYLDNGEAPSLRYLTRDIELTVLPNPRQLWRSIDTPADIEYYKPDTECKYLSVDNSCENNTHKNMLAASRRGRSHAQDGRPRDDHYSLSYDPQSQWYVMAVADGAGSAKYSRRGSQIACDTVTDYCRSKLNGNHAFDDAIQRYYRSKHDVEFEVLARKALGDMVYGIVGNAAYIAHKRINEEAAKRPDASPKDYATTLLLTICRKYAFGWFIASFWVGDGAICLYDRKSHSATLLGIADEGEFSGQTRFLTMPEIFADAESVYRRLRFEIKDDFTALILMTDGVSDPMFETDVNLNNVACWDAFWDMLQKGFPDDSIPGVNLESKDEAAEQLLQWLTFWRVGEHDDRTIAMLY